MKNTGTLRIQTFAARQSAPVEGVTVAVQGDGFTLHRITDATGSTADIPVEAPACTLSLDEDNTTRPYAIVSLTAAKVWMRRVPVFFMEIRSFTGKSMLLPQRIPSGVRACMAMHTANKKAARRRQGRKAYLDYLALSLARAASIFFCRAARFSSLSMPPSRGWPTTLPSRSKT